MTENTNTQKTKTEKSQEEQAGQKRLMRLVGLFLVLCYEITY